MRKIREGKPILAETAVSIGGRPLILRAFPDHLELREKWRRKKSAVVVEYEVVFRTALGLQFLVPDQPAHKPAPARRRAANQFAGKFDLDKFEIE